jgi:hypothetical protein
MNIFERAGFHKFGENYIENDRLEQANTTGLRVRECTCGLVGRHYIATGKGFAISRACLWLAAFIDNPQYCNFEIKLARRMFTFSGTTATKHPFVITRTYEFKAPQSYARVHLDYDFGADSARIRDIDDKYTLDKFLRANINDEFTLEVVRRIRHADKRQRAADAKIEQLIAALNGAIDQINELREALAFAPGGPIAQAAAESFAARLEQ